MLVHTFVKVQSACNMDRLHIVLYGPVRFTRQEGPYYTNHRQKVRTGAVSVTWPDTLLGHRLLCNLCLFVNYLICFCNEL